MAKPKKSLRTADNIMLTADDTMDYWNRLFDQKLNELKQYITFNCAICKHDIEDIHNYIKFTYTTIDNARNELSNLEQHVFNTYYVCDECAYKTGEEKRNCSNLSDAAFFYAMEVYNAKVDQEYLESIGIIDY